jgi:phosphatidylglycerol lysyltransferase
MPLPTDAPVIRQPYTFNAIGVQLVATVAFLNGLSALLDVLFTRLPARLELIVPLDFDPFGRLFGVFAGFILIYFAGQLRLRKRAAWWIAVAASVVVLLAHVVYAHTLLGLVLPLGNLIVLMVFRRQYVVGWELQSLAQGLRLLVISLAIAMAYGTIGFYILPAHDFRPPHHATLSESAIRTVKEFILIGNDDLVLHSRRVQWFTASLDLLGSTSILFALYSLFRPLAYRYGTMPAERERARQLLDRYGSSSEDAFKLWPEDKAYYFHGECFIAYRVDHGVAMVLGEPVGPSTEWPTLLGYFKNFCRDHDWSLTLIYVPDTHLALFEQAGLRALKIGEDAVVGTAEYAASTVRNKHWRGVRNKFVRLGYQFEASEAPQMAPLLQACAGVTKSWHSVGGRREGQFALGYHDRAYLQRSRLFVVRDKSGRVQAFANEIRTYDAKRATIDLMRYRPGAETGVMEWLLSEIILWSEAHGYAEFSLGLAPLAGVGHGSDPSLEERVIAVGGRLGVGGFSYEGLRRFKNKFNPNWEARFLVYERGPSGLTRTLLAINSLIRS